MISSSKQEPALGQEAELRSPSTPQRKSIFPSPRQSLSSSKRAHSELLVNMSPDVKEAILQDEKLNSSDRKRAKIEIKTPPPSSERGGGEEQKKEEEPYVQYKMIIEVENFPVKEFLKCENENSHDILVSLSAKIGNYKFESRQQKVSDLIIGSENKFFLQQTSRVKHKDALTSIFRYDPFEVYLSNFNKNRQTSK